MALMNTASVRLRREPVIIPIYAPQPPDKHPMFLERRVYQGSSGRVYSMSKGGLFMMMRELALEFSPFGITVNNVAPGAIRTDMNREVMSDPAYEARVIARTPARFIGEPEDVANAVVFLTSPDARFITGTTLFVDGGLTL
jgi:NAD(P)-dependent dehydrogenase (short-subunit alcohol dehydrogenase family)